MSLSALCRIIVAMISVCDASYNTMNTIQFYSRTPMQISSEASAIVLGGTCFWVHMYNNRLQKVAYFPSHLF